MKLIASIVFYNPSDDCITRAKGLAKVFDWVVVVDNSTKALDVFKSEKKIEYIPLMENKGIAFALNKALDYAKSGDFDFLMTFDQDSTYPASRHQEIKELLGKQPNDVALYSLDPEGSERDLKDKWKHPNFVITSGSFLRLSFFREKPIRFMDELFIDNVDFELNRQILLHGGKIVENHEITFGHTIGNPLIVRFLWKKIHLMNHSPIRFYYRFRNIYYLYRLDKKFYGKLYRETKFKGRITMFLCEPNAKEKNRYVRRGIRDAKRGILGPYSD